MDLTLVYTPIFQYPTFHYVSRRQFVDSTMIACVIPVYPGHNIIFPFHKSCKNFRQGII